ncbi:MAG: thioredoxin domain-containing protein [Candidatus Moraniibacteriota bacterium]
MAKKENKKEGEDNQENFTNNKEHNLENDVSRVNLTANHSEDNSEYENGQTLDEIEEENKKDKKIKNLASLAIVLAGLFVGSLFVDVIQFITKSGYSESALRNANTFVLGDKTWVAYQEPAVQAKVLVAEDEEECPECNPDQVLDWMKKFIPTMVVDKVSASSEEGKRIIEKYDFKAIPSFAFEKEVEDSDFFQEGQMNQVFEEKDGDYVLNGAALGIPVGKYLNSPEINENDAVIGNKEAEKKAVIFSDFQCPYSKNLYEASKELADDMGRENVAFVYKDMPLDFHSQAQNAALAAQCSNEQDKFEEMADLLFGNQDEWSESEGKESFKQYAKQLDLDTEKFDKCLEEEKFKEEVENSLKLGRDYGVSGTPATFVEGELLSGAIGKDQLKKALEGEPVQNNNLNPSAGGGVQGGEELSEEEMKELEKLLEEQGN